MANNKIFVFVTLMSGYMKQSQKMKAKSHVISAMIY